MAPIRATPALRALTKTTTFVWLGGITTGAGARTTLASLVVNRAVVAIGYGDPMSSVSGIGVSSGHGPAPETAPRRH